MRSCILALPVGAAPSEVSSPQSHRETACRRAVSVESAPHGGTVDPSRRLGAHNSLTQPVQPETLLLASTSPRRQALLREAKYSFDVAAPPMAEPDPVHAHVAATSHVESLAFFKACSVASEHPTKTILGADTIAVLGDRIIGKPSDREDARRILTLLSGTVHSVITGLALLEPALGRRMLTHEVSTIHVRPLSPETIEAYLDTGEWRGKAGAYGIQDHGDAFVERVEGSFTNVVGLPMERLALLMSQWVEQASMFKPGSTVIMLDGPA